MSTIEVNKIAPVSGGTSVTMGDSGDTFTVTSGATFNASSSNLANRPNALPIIINGDMAISQRSTSVTGDTAGGYLTCDRIRPSFANIGTYTFIQESLTSGNAFANGFTKAFRLDCTTADASPAAGDYFYLAYKMEGNNLQAFKKGTANAQKMTLAFWVKSNKTGTAQVNMNDQDNTRMCSGTYTISSANTWEHKIINIAADTTGAFDNDNANSMQIEWWLDGGSNFQGGTVPTAWEARTNPDRGVSDLAIADSTSNDFAITGIQLEVGEYTSSTIPPFQHESFGDNLERCERYYQVIGTGTRADNKMYYSAYNVDGTSTMFGTFNFRTTMRAEPSLDQTSGTNYYTFNCNNASDDFDGVNGIRGGIHGTLLYLSGGSSVGSSNAGMGGSVLGKDASSHVALSSEL